MSEVAAGGLDQEIRVLVVLDDELLAEVVRLTLNHGVCATLTVKNAIEVADAVPQWRPKLALVDLDLSSSRLLEQLNIEPGVRMGVIGLTRRGGLRAKLQAFEQGMDDIVTVPFSPEELLARVVAVTRRIYRQQVLLKPVLQAGELELDILNRRVRVESEEIHLTAIELSLLYLLVANAGKVVTRDQILDALWGFDYVAESNLVDRHIRNLRAKLEGNLRQRRFIAKVRGRGYRFAAEMGQPLR